MDKRFFLALVLTAIVIVGTQMLFPGPTRQPSPGLVDSVSRRAQRPDSIRPRATPTTSSQIARDSNARLLNVGTPTAVVETTTVRNRSSSFAFSSHGGAPVSIVLDSYPSRRPRSRGNLQPVELVRPGSALMKYRIVMAADTVALDTIPLHATRATGQLAGASTLAYEGVVNGHSLRLEYQPVPDSFLVRVRVSVQGAPTGSSMLIDLPRALQSNEPDTLDDMNHLAVSYRGAHGDVNSVGFSKLDSTAVRTETGPLRWVATRNKYFLVAYRAPEKSGFSQLQLRGVSHTGKVAGEALAMAALPLAPDGAAAFDVYAGPQDFRRLRRLGGDLDQVNPYGGWLNGVVQPFATIVMRALLWMKDTTKLNYGWVLVLFGVLIRFALWPLNQGAMRTSMKMQRLQPELQAIQKKYADDRQRLQEATMKLYKDHGMSPLSPLMGCLPMLLPMPILFALYFVFQNTIEFRGVSFLWLPDISLHDPYYITPVLMGISMFVMSWIGMKGSPPNPQAKMMMYMMPVMLTVFFLNLASGLNLYYAVQNIAALPQQWLLARERSQQAGAIVASAQGPGPTVKRRS
jgi:YidC/Oxa1 family membrane protein insertase